MYIFYNTIYSLRWSMANSQLTFEVWKHTRIMEIDTLTGNFNKYRKT